MSILEIIGLSLLIGLGLNFISSPFKYFTHKKIQDVVEIFRLPNNNFHIIINGMQYRFVENINNFYASETYKFPSGIKCDHGQYRNELDSFQDLILNFKESEQVESRKKLYEAEMFVDLSDAFSKWDKEFSTKALNK